MNDISFEYPGTTEAEFNNELDVSINRFDNFWVTEKKYLAKTIDEKKELMLGPVFCGLPSELISIIFSDVKINSTDWHCILDYSRVNTIWYAYWTSDTVFGGYVPHFVLDRSPNERHRLLSVYEDDTYTPGFQSVRTMFIKENMHIWSSLHRKTIGDNIGSIVDAIIHLIKTRDKLLDRLAYLTMPDDVLDNETPLLDINPERKQHFKEKLWKVVNTLESGKLKLRANESIIQKRWQADRLLDIVENESKKVSEHYSSLGKYNSETDVMSILIEGDLKTDLISENHLKDLLASLLPFIPEDMTASFMEKIEEEGKATREVYTLGKEENLPKPSNMKNNKKRKRLLYLNCFHLTDPKI